MPPKKKKGRVTLSAEMYSALDALHLPSDEFSPGAVEALRLCHVQFLSRMTSELALLGREDEQFTIQPEHVDQCLEKMGFADYTEKLGSTTNTSKKKAASRSKKRKKWSTEMEAEQERLLAQSKETIQHQQQQKQS